MRVVKLHHPTGHPYWQRDEYQIELPNGEKINPGNHIQDNYGGYRVFWDEKGIWVQICASGSGYGKVDRKDIAPKLLVSSSDYDKIDFVGQKLEMSDALKADLSENGLS